MSATRPGMGAFVIAAAGVAAFIIYGSLVPFEFRDRSWTEAVDSFHWAVTHRVWPASRSDWIANVRLGVALGFFLLGALRTGRSSFWGTILTAILIWPFCVGLAVAVEFGQVFVPGRTASGSDIIAQGLGAAVGMLGWVEFGPTFTGRLIQFSDRPEADDVAARILLGYFVILGLVLYLPLDLTLSPVEAARKLYRSVTYTPFGEFASVASGKGWEQVQHWLELCLVYVPIGLLLSRIRTARDSIHHRMWMGIVGIPLVFEMGQLFVQSRVPNTSGVLAGIIGIGMGVGLGRMRSSAAAMIGMLLWFMAMAVIMWQPFNFAPSIFETNVLVLPFGDIQFSNALRLLDQFLTRTVLYGFFGVAIQTILGGPRSVIVMVATVAGTVVAAGFEYGQQYLPSRTASSSDLVLAFIGSGVGAWVASLIPTRGVADQEAA